MENDCKFRTHQENKLRKCEAEQQKQLSNMYQLEINLSHTRADSPSITTSTTTQPVSSSSNHSTNVLSNGQYNNGYKMNNCNDQQSKNRICRDFVRGSCRRLLCKVNIYFKIYFGQIKLTFRLLIYCSIHMLLLLI